MHRFDTLDEVHSSLQRLIDRDPPLVRMLSRQPGTKESRYMHLLAGDVADPIQAPAAEVPQSQKHSIESQLSARLAAIEEDLAALRKEVAELRSVITE
jgi:hypothetical protein